MTEKYHHTETKKVMDRLSRAAGHMEAVKKMVMEDRDCSDVLIQLAAVRSAINNVGKIILKDHMEHCVAEAVGTGNREALSKFQAAMNQFLK